VQVPNTRVPGIAWPALPGPPGATHLAIQFQLQQTQWWDAARLAQFQFRQLHSLLRFAAQEVPFYRERLAAYAQPNQPLTPEAWREIPLLRRVDIQQAAPELLARRLPPRHGKVFEVGTTGSTGTPLRVTKTEIAQLFFLALNLRNHLWFRRDFSKKLCSIRMLRGREHQPQGDQARGWSPAFPPGPFHALDISLSLDAQIDWLLNEAPSYLLTYPSNLDALAQRMAERGATLPSLEDVTCFGETLGHEVRERVTALIGVPVRDMYSAQEIGVIALECPDRPPNYHVAAECMFVEVLDDAGRPCKPGEIGRLVVTPLHNYAMPLLRYDIGDWAEVGTPCPCGRGLPALARIVGRTRNMIVMPDGTRRWPNVRFKGLAARVPIRQFQFVQRKRNELIGRLVVPRKVTSDEEVWIRDQINGELGATFDIRFEYTDHIARAPGGKFEDFRCEIPLPS
jgi:phenylacetate-CoA ligase